MKNLLVTVVASVLALPTLVHAAPPTATHAIAPVQLDHISIVTVGTGPAIVLIPGLASPRAVWDGVVPALAATHTVHLVQINGFDGGDPRGNLKPGLIDGVIAELDAYLTARHIVRPKIVGHSLGGLIALKFARDRPDAVGPLMIVDALPYVGLIFAPNATVAALEPTARAMAAQMSAGYGKPADVAAQTATAQRLALKPASVVKVAAWGAKADPRVVAQGFYEDMTIDLRPDLARIAAPVTLVYPWSAAAPKAAVEPLYRGSFAGLANVRYVDIGDAAHFVMLDQPDAFAAALKTFADAPPGTP